MQDNREAKGCTPSLSFLIFSLHQYSQLFGSFFPYFQCVQSDQFSQWFFISSLELSLFTLRLMFLFKKLVMEDIFWPTQVASSLAWSNFHKKNKNKKLEK